MPLIFSQARLRHALAITVILLAIWLIPPASRWFEAFVKLSSMRLPYTMAFFTLLFFLLSGMARIVIRKSFLAALFIGAILGQVASLVSIFVANIFIQNGIERTFKTITREGLSDVIEVDFAVSFILGGWLIGAVAFGALKLVGRGNLNIGK